MARNKSEGGRGGRAGEGAAEAACVFDNLNPPPALQRFIYEIESRHELTKVKLLTSWWITGIVSANNSIVDKKTDANTVAVS
mgnify:CR=1 FL=1